MLLWKTKKQGIYNKKVKDLTIQELREIIKNEVELILNDKEMKKIKLKLDFYNSYGLLQDWRLF